MMKRFAPAAMIIALAACEGEVEPRPEIEDTDISEVRDLEGLNEADLPPTADGVIDPEGPVQVPVEIMVEGQAVDGCPSRGTVRERADVHAAPQPTAPVIDRLPAGKMLALCESGIGQNWWGVVYPDEGDIAGCETTTALSTGNTYAGPCRSGWVATRNIELEPVASVPSE